MRESWDNAWIIAKRELRSYFATPLALVFLTVFVALTGALTFYVGNFFDRGQADLIPFFAYHPWLYLLLVPAVAMRLWAEERKTGTIELLMTLPISPFEAILGKSRCVGFRRPGAGADLPHVDHGQRSRRP
jgi:ABC-2 type transport system permease protein